MYFSGILSKSRFDMGKCCFHVDVYTFEVLRTLVSFCVFLPSTNTFFCERDDAISLYWKLQSARQNQIFSWSACRPEGGKSLVESPFKSRHSENSQGSFGANKEFWLEPFKRDAVREGPRLEFPLFRRQPTSTHRRFQYPDVNRKKEDKSGGMRFHHCLVKEGSCIFSLRKMNAICIQGGPFYINSVELRHNKLIFLNFNQYLQNGEYEYS